jgi:hypothetical protein
MLDGLGSASDQASSIETYFLSSNYDIECK